MNLTCERCGAEFKPRQKGRANRFCTAACYNASGRPRRKEVTVLTRMMRVPGHPIAPPGGTVAESRLVLYDKIGPGTHPCEWCEKPVTWKPGDRTSADSLFADHLDWNRHNNDPANLVPSCNACNAHRVRGGGRAPIIESELFIVNRNGSRTRATPQNCANCGSEYLARVSEIKIGKGIYCSRSCARQSPRVPRSGEVERPGSADPS